LTVSGRVQATNPRQQPSGAGHELFLLNPDDAITFSCSVSINRHLARKVNGYASNRRSHIHVALDRRKRRAGGHNCRGQSPPPPQRFAFIRPADRV
jgi:hypothetical protein